MVKEALIQDITKHFQRHPSVTRQLRKFMTGKVPRKSTEDNVGRYLQEIGQYRLLRAEEEAPLFHTIEDTLARIDGMTFQEAIGSDDPQIKEALVNMTAAYQTIYSTNLRLSVAIAKRLKVVNTMELIDLIAEGNYGLHKAIVRFDINRGFKFSTFATWWVRQQVTRAIADQSRAIRMPVHAHESYLRLLKDMRDVSNYMGKEATAQDMAELYGDDIAKVEFLLQRGRNYQPSLNAMTEDSSPSTNAGGGTELADILPQLAHDPFEGHIEDAVVREGVSELLAQTGLDERSQLVVCFRMGLMPKRLQEVVLNGERVGDIHSVGDKKTLEDLGQIFGITRERIRQIEAKALDRLNQTAVGGRVDTSFIPWDISADTPTD